MKKVLSLALFGILAITGLAFNTKAANLKAKSNVPPKNELKKFDKFLDKHRNIETDLRGNPGLVNDAQYLSNHKDLEAFLRKNPKITTDLSSNPNYFMDRETRYEKKEKHKQKSAKSKKHWWHPWGK